jgi:hypothetical protein
MNNQQQTIINNIKNATAVYETRTDDNGSVCLRTQAGDFVVHPTSEKAWPTKFNSCRKSES